MIYSKLSAVSGSSLQFNELLSEKYDDDDCPRLKRFHADCEKKIPLDEHLKKPLRKKGFSFSPGTFVNIPKINRGERYQASVSDWVDREITEDELAEIPDRDEKVFDCNLIAHLDPQAIAAFEMLACSEAVPIPGRNKELALHLLMANKGNLTEAVADLMKVDMLNWEHTPVVYHSIYNDSVFWTPSEIALFQEAIYKSEKDFTEVVRKTVKQCVEFFYLWKKAFPDDYKKLSNLVRKRRLLTQSAAHKDKSQKDESESGSEHSSFAAEDREQRTTDESWLAFFFTIFPKLHLCLIKIICFLFKQVHRGAIKKGAQPASDGYFHCRLCDKYFEKVKSLNAHMKSHAMKARAEAEAQAQMNFQYSGSGGGNSNMRDKLVSANVSVTNVSNTSAQLGQNQLSAVARAANALSQTASFNAVNALNQAALAQAQDLFVSTSLSQDPLVQSTLLQSPLSQASLAAQGALGPSSLRQVSQNAIGQAAASQAAALGQAAQTVLGQAANQGAINSAAQGALAPSTLSSVLGQGLPVPPAALQLFNSLHPTISHSSV
uniref:C2H2-type domain-containing protein n=1 Tax=Syphacia muris TaxID=451379 RepID=A0A0N5AXZ6_9BILA